jgi:hypothetical protein
MSNNTQTTLFYTERSPFARKVQLVLNQLGIAVKKEIVEFSNPSEEFIRMGPARKGTFNPETRLTSSSKFIHT